MRIILNPTPSQIGSDMEQAEIEVFNHLAYLGFDTEVISDTGTVENLMDLGLTVEQIAKGKFTPAQLNDSISWL